MPFNNVPASTGGPSTPGIPKNDSSEDQKPNHNPEVLPPSKQVLEDAPGMNFHANPS